MDGTSPVSGSKAAFICALLNNAAAFHRITQPFRHLHNSIRQHPTYSIYSILSDELVDLDETHGTDFLNTSSFTPHSRRN